MVRNVVSSNDHCRYCGTLIYCLLLFVQSIQPDKVVLFCFFIFIIIIITFLDLKGSRIAPKVWEHSGSPAVPPWQISKDSDAVWKV